MRVTISTRVIGDKDVIKWLNSLEPAVRKKVLRPAVTAAARPIRMAAKRNVPVRFGHLKKSIDLKTRTSKGGAYAVVGPRSDITVQSTDFYGRKMTIKPSKYAHLAEEGTSPHQITIVMPNGTNVVWNHPGSPGSHFLERAMDSEAAKSSRILNDRILAGIEKHT